MLTFPLAREDDLDISAPDTMHRAMRWTVVKVTEEFEPLLGMGLWRLCQGGSGRLPKEGEESCGSRWVSQG